MTAEQGAKDILERVHNDLVIAQLVTNSLIKETGQDKIISDFYRSVLMELQKIENENQKTVNH